MAKWTPKGRPAQRNALRRWRAKNKTTTIKISKKNKKPVKPLSQYWPERRLMNLVIAGIIVPEVEEEK